MERIQTTTTTTTTTNYSEGSTTHSTSTVTVRELDDGDAESSSSLTPPMLNVPIIHYDVSDTESVLADEIHHDSHVHDPMDDNWFPSLSNASWIQDLDKHDSGDDGDMLMTDRATETLFASDIVEIDDDDNFATALHERPTKSRRTNHGLGALDPMEKNFMEGDIVISDSYNSLENSSGLVPLDVVYTALND